MEKGHLLLTGFVWVRPAAQQLKSSLEMVLRPAGDTGHFTFLLHRGLELEFVTGEDISHWEYLDDASGSFSPEARQIRVDLEGLRGAGDAIRLSVAYSGQIGRVTEWEINRITREWVELGLYSPWFPLVPDGQDVVHLDYDLEVTLEGDYHVVGAQRIEGKTDGWRLASKRSGQDMVLLAAPGFHSLKRTDGNASMFVHRTGVEDQAAAQALGATGLDLLNFYREWFSDPTSREITVVIAPRSVGGGYVRHSLMVLSEDALTAFETEAVKTFKWLAHEIAHLWWDRAPSGSWEDWLNESMAEYCALRAVAARYSEKICEAMVNDKREKMKGLPPVKGLERTSPHAADVLYSKGCVLLHDLREQTGESAFTALLRRLLAMEALSTERFLEALSDVAGPEIARDFEAVLRE